MTKKTERRMRRTIKSLDDLELTLKNMEFEAELKAKPGDTITMSDGMKVVVPDPLHLWTTAGFNTDAQTWVMRCFCCGHFDKNPSQGTAKEITDKDAAILNKDFPQDFFKSVPLIRC